ncbi:hypothetical protein ACJX0J_022545, partial [Zea mays]
MYVMQATHGILFFFFDNGNMSSGFSMKSPESEPYLMHFKKCMRIIVVLYFRFYMQIWHMVHPSGLFHFPTTDTQLCECLSDSNLIGGLADIYLDIKDPHLWWMMGFMFLANFVGLFALMLFFLLQMMQYALLNENSQQAVAVGISHSSHQLMDGLIHTFLYDVGFVVSVVGNEGYFCYFNHVNFNTIFGMSYFLFTNLAIYNM